MQWSEAPFGFDWDEGNRGKSVKKHGIADEESEEAFFDPEKKILKDILHSGAEERFILLGKTAQGKILFIVFTVRESKIRIISSRPINQKERYLYEKEA
jgi:uncharacterized DUF497 family protein